MALGALVVAFATGAVARAAPGGPVAATTVTLHLPATAPNPHHPEVLVRVPPTVTAALEESSPRMSRARRARGSPR